MDVKHRLRSAEWLSRRVNRTPPPSKITVESIKRDLNAYLRDLDFWEDDESVVVTPKRFLGHKKFVSISSLVEEVGGIYVSSGRKSHFLIKKSSL